mmetsp:Transcript_6630/g.23425  ORF Transcript_6630/g.23425 Transcript_6630/m.23425 type:complete len:447 (-) Transcript_6630:1244-2584(-)|eukprot:CAMPEP_0183789432 /NCGR_PEP_ID=MMETSP0803_2-20130417/418_1 /TAXON_ID=195967 /ORGANISM="Crustomastix stigmata, Strain CCMP3273" /LENGTH=446 /DNA_ID=CAMNT_0026033601 /DNA_START=64 /DNA_END=1404 /DNA_ORIENTATION=-
MTRRAIFVAAGSRGDVLPMLLIAKQLLQVGWDCVLNASADHENLVKHFGVKFVPNPRVTNSEGKTVTALMHDAHMRKGDPVAVLQAVTWKPGSRWYGARLQTLMSICQDADVIICTAQFVWSLASIAAERTGASLVVVQYFPLVPSPGYCCGIISDRALRVQQILGRPRFNKVQQYFNLATFYWFFFRHQWAYERSVMLEYRKDHNMKPKTLISQYFQDDFDAAICAWCPYVYPSVSLPLKFCHYGFLREQDKSGSCCCDISKFLLQGERPVCIGWGSTTGGLTPSELTNLALKALHKSHSRGVILGGWGDVALEHVTEANIYKYAKDNVFFLKEASHSEILPKCALVVHHGGAGTFAAAAQAGIPQIICPTWFDQWTWQSRAVTHGVSIAMPPLPFTSAYELGTAISYIKHDPAYKERALKLKNMVQSDDGLRVASSINALSVQN